MKKCVIASDSFKETLPSKQIAVLFEIEFKKVVYKIDVLSDISKIVGD